MAPLIHRPRAPQGRGINSFIWAAHSSRANIKQKFIKMKWWVYPQMTQEPSQHVSLLWDPEANGTCPRDAPAGAPPVTPGAPSCRHSSLPDHGLTAAPPHPGLLRDAPPRARYGRWSIPDTRCFLLSNPNESPHPSVQNLSHSLRAFVSRLFTFDYIRNLWASYILWLSYLASAVFFSSPSSFPNASQVPEEICIMSLLSI